VIDNEPQIVYRSETKDDGQRFSSGTERARPVKGTVIRTDAEYTKRTYGSFSSHDKKMTNGIEVEFDGPMITDYDSFAPAVNPSYTNKANDERKKRAVTRVVVEARCITEPWEDIARRREVEQASLRRWHEENDRRAENVEPLIEAVEAELRDHDHPKGSVIARITEKDGLTKKRKVGAKYEIEIEVLADLLGVKVGS
jgi:hypothetical protein